MMRTCVICGKQFKTFPKRKTQCCGWSCRNRYLSKVKKDTYVKNTTYEYRQDICILRNTTYDGHKVYMNGKYPAIYVNGSNYNLHRYVWEQHYGEIPKRNGDTS